MIHVSLPRAAQGRRRNVSPPLIARRNPPPAKSRILRGACRSPIRTPANTSVSAHFRGAAIRNFVTRRSEALCLPARHSHHTSAPKLPADLPPRAGHLDRFPPRCARVDCSRSTSRLFRRPQRRSRPPHPPSPAAGGQETASSIRRRGDPVPGSAFRLAASPRPPHPARSAESWSDRDRREASTFDRFRAELSIILVPQQPSSLSASKAARFRSR